MTAGPLQDYIIEVLEEQPVTINTAASSSHTVEVEIGSALKVGDVPQPEIVEVFSMPPVGGGYDRVEVLPFTKQGSLSITPNGSEFPIAGGDFRVESIAGRVTTAPTGSAIILDVLKNNVSIFSNAADRPTIAPGSNNVVVGDFGTVMLADGDYLEVIIVQVGSTTPGETLVASIRLTRIG